MRVPLSWLSEFTPLGVDARDAGAVSALGAELDSLGLVVEAMDRVGGELAGVVVARVGEIRPIPGADHIRAVTVDAGGPPIDVVCGAWNFGVGDVVALATVGATLAGGVEITRRTMRGVSSNGMLCSARELGLGADTSGLFILAATGAAEAPLPAGLELGTPLGEYLGLVADVVFELEIEPNRPDCLCVAGVARDLAARRRLPFSIPQPMLSEEGPPIEELASVRIEAPEACRRFAARVVTGVGAVVSPPEVQRRLILSGMRPIHSVVDSSNYAMLELGQPTHPYDLDRLSGRGLRVRYARPGETLTTLDGVSRVVGVERLRSGEERRVEDLLICDGGDGPVGIAGVMGGESSEIGAATRAVLIESAAFAAMAVGRTARRQELRTEASTRFWRGVDPEGARRGADRVAELIAAAARAAGAAPPLVARGVIDVHPDPAPRRRVGVRPARLNALLGTALGVDTIVAYLAPLGFVASGSADELAVEVPSFRPDAEREVDVIEEVARLHGYGKIAPTQRRSPGVGRLSAYQADRRRLAGLLSGAGANEAWTSSIVNPEAERRVGKASTPVVVANPVVREEAALRTHLLPGLLAALRHNTSSRNASVRFYEIGRVFSHPAPGDELPAEREHLGALLARDGDDAAAAVRLWHRIAEGLGIEPSAIELAQDEMASRLMAEDPVALGCHPTRTAAVRGAEPDGTAATVGFVGEVDPAALGAFEIAGRRVGWLVVDLARLFCLPRRVGRAPELSRFPSSDIDLAFALDASVPAARLESVLRAAAGEYCESVRLVDVFRGPGLPPGSRSLAFRLRFVAPDRTLTDADVGAVRARCIGAAMAELGAELRG
ncbi:MAG: phenylalanine--tRNA ligase subunit beta [Acidimicrobiales bacterium]